MKAYEFIADADEYTSFVAATRAGDKQVERFYDAEPLAASWKPLKIKFDGVRGRLPDLATLGGAPVFSARAWLALEALIGPLVEALPIQAPEGGAYVAVHVLNVIDALDEQRSKFSYFTSGEIMGIDKHVFRQEVLAANPLFRIPQSPGTIYFTDAFLAVVRKSKLTGLGVSKLT